jgi:CheY-like chemotaxis protein
LKSPTVLCVDDADAILDFYEDLLCGHGYEVLPARDGTQALEAFRANAESIDAAILDYEMPGMNGFELAVRLKSHDPALPILMISGHLPDLEEMLPFVDAALSKGVPVTEILDGIKLLIATREDRGAA